MIELVEVCKTYQQGGKRIEALKPLNLNVAQGSIFGIVGGSGAGKSTLIRCVNLLERPDGGHVRIDGQDLMAMSQQQLRQVRSQIAMIFQHFNLLSSRTVFANVALPLELAGLDKASISERVNDLLNMVGLSDKAQMYPSQLSGGQKQRVAIARALATKPKVLLCDEATSALDPQTTTAILDLLKQINKQLGLTILLITHEMEVVKRICDRVALIDGGELVEQGDVGSFFAHAKTPLAQDFVASTLHLSIPERYSNALSATRQAGAHPLLKLSFNGDSVDVPAITQLARHFEVDLNIISAQMDYLGESKFGIMLAELMGSEEREEQVINYLIEHKIIVEQLGYVS